MSIVDTDGRDRADMGRLAAGHEAALNDLMERYAAPMYHFLFRMLASEEDAHDLAQETFVRVYLHRSKFRAGEKFTTWLYTIAANLARNHHRWKARHPTVSIEAHRGTTDLRLEEILPAPDAPPNELAEAGERAAGVRAAVERLPEDFREAIILCEWEDLSVAEAAAVLQTTPKAVESRLYRARHLLREKLAQWL